MIKLCVILDVERDRLSVIEHHRHAAGRDSLDGAERSVLHAYPAFVLQEHDAVARSKRAGATPGRDFDIVPKLSGATQMLTRSSVQRLHLIIGMGEDDPRRIRCGRSFAVPAIDQIGAGSVARGGDMDMTALIIGGDSFGRALGRQMPRRIALPVRALTADGGIANRAPFIQFGESDGYPDGMTVDVDDALWIAHWGVGRVSRFHPDGTLDHAIALPARQTTNVTFSGSNLTRMFVTSATIGLGATPADGALFEVFSAAQGMSTHRFGS